MLFYHIFNKNKSRDIICKMQRKTGIIKPDMFFRGEEHHGRGSAYETRDRRQFKRAL